MTRGPTTRGSTWTLPRAPADPRARAASVGIAVLVHALLIVLVMSIESPPAARPGPPGWALSLTQPDEGGGGGGGAPMTMLRLPPAPPTDLAAPEIVPTPDPVVPDVEIPDLAVDPSALVLAVPPDSLPTTIGASPSGGAGGGAGGGSGPGSGPGSGGGTGVGTGPGVGGGSGGDGIRPPAPLTIIPPAATASVRGKQATVRLQVDSVGVVRDADVVVSSGDRGYDEKLRRTAMGWRFRPARDAANRPIPYPFEVSFRF